MTASTCWKNFSSSADMLAGIPAFNRFSLEISEEGFHLLNVKSTWRKTLCNARFDLFFRGRKGGAYDNPVINCHGIPCHDRCCVFFRGAVGSFFSKRCRVINRFSIGSPTGVAKSMYAVPKYPARGSYTRGFLTRSRQFNQ